MAPHALQRPAARPAKPATKPWPRRRSFRTQGCVFQNADNPKAQPSQPAWKIWTRFLSPAPPGTVPVDAIPVRKLDRAMLDALDPAANHIIRLGHSSHLLKLRGKYWLIDPVFGERVSPFSFAGPKRFHLPPLALTDLPPIEGLILSHDHYDHLDLPTIEYLQRAACNATSCRSAWRAASGHGRRGQAHSRVRLVADGSHAGVRLTAVPAQHFSGRTLCDRNRTLWAGWVIESGDQRIFYSGDSGYFPGFKQIGERFGGFDLALMENGAYDSYWPAVHMSPEETVQAFQDVRAPNAVRGAQQHLRPGLPHLARPDGARRRAGRSQGPALATPEIGEVLTIGQPRTNVLWWKGLK